MKSGWLTRKLGEVATLQRGFDLPTQHRVSGRYPLVSSSGISDTHHKSAVPGPGVVTGRSGSIGNVFFIEDDFWPLNTVLYIKDFHGNDPRFVFYLLQHFDLTRFATGAGVPTLNRNFVHDELVCIPTSISEQQRIARILDEAFEGIATATANAEKNLQKARALFKSRLQSVFNHRGEGWIDTTIGEQVILQRGFDITKDQQNPGNVPVVSSGGIKSFHDKAMAAAPGVVIGRKGTLGKVFYLEDDYWPHDTTLWVKDFKGNHPRLVYYFFNGLDVVKLDSGAANPALNRNQVHPIEIIWPPVARQQAIASMLDKLSIETERLETICQHKLGALTAFKQSMLHEAFAGNL